LSLSRQKLAALLERSSRAAGSARLDVDTGLYIPEQRAVLRSRHKRKLLRCGRRAGKSEAVAGFLTDRVTTPPFTNVFYLTLTLKNAKRIIWPKLRALNKAHNLGGVPNDGEGRMSYPHLGEDVHIYLGGCKDTTEIEKWRGIAGKAWAVDETQSFPQRIIRPLYKDAIRPAAMDYRGEIMLSGTPGPLCSGFFYEKDHDDEWQHHRWTVRENTLLPARVAGDSIDEILAEVLRENKWLPDNPTFLREYLNTWVQDFDALVFKYIVDRNGFEDVPAGAWHYVVGVDFGFEDADAFAVLGWREHDKAVYLIEEFTRPKQGITEPAQQIQALIDKYKPLKVMADLGALGKKIGEEIRRRFGIPVEAADKHRKLEHIALLNDALLGQRFFARPTGVFAEDAAVVQWDQDKRAVGTLAIADDFHSDITDAVLYAYRACYGWIQGPARELPKTDGDAFALRLAVQAARQRAEEMIDGED
jgi:hypothetical protein